MPFQDLESLHVLEVFLVARKPYWELRGFARMIVCRKEIFEFGTHHAIQILTTRAPGASAGLSLLP